ncbi:MAG: helix-turn-helix transcriptional regulator [Sphingomonadales bacterium]|nr:helix-turn-helix transcriptional regulator [Sphingomonadales bacterium]MBD3773433.1 helix-turn-helix transcriptional regulator [Paracoccaceae bacterium]
MKLQKGTEPSAALHGKWYDDACGTAFGLEVLGERWSMLVVRELMLGSRRFSDLRASLPGISAKVLTERLEGLERAGVLVRRQLPPPGKVQVYELTEWGLLAEPAIQELGRWAARSPRHDPTLPLSPVSLMLSLRTMVDREKAAAVQMNVGFEIGDDHFLAEIGGGNIEVRRAPTTGAELRFRAPAAPLLAGLIYGKVPADALPWLEIEGGEELRGRFLDIFQLPPKVGS